MLLNRYTTNAKELNGSSTIRQQYSTSESKRPIMLPPDPGSRKKPRIAKIR